MQIGAGWFGPWYSQLPVLQERSLMPALGMAAAGDSLALTN